MKMENKKSFNGENKTLSKIESLEKKIAIHEAEAHKRQILTLCTDVTHAIALLVLAFQVWNSNAINDQLYERLAILLPFECLCTRITSQPIE